MKNGKVILSYCIGVVLIALGLVFIEWTNHHYNLVYDIVTDMIGLVLIVIGWGTLEYMD